MTSLQIRKQVGLQLSGFSLALLGTAIIYIFAIEGINSLADAPFESQLFIAWLYIVYFLVWPVAGLFLALKYRLVGSSIGVAFGLWHAMGYIIGMLTIEPSLSATLIASGSILYFAGMALIALTLIRTRKKKSLLNG